MSAPVQLVIAVPLSAAVGRMPEALVAGAMDVVLERVAGAPEWLWRSPSGGGRVGLSAVSAVATGLVVTADSDTPAPVADALTVELLGALERTWAPSVPPAPAGPARRRRQIAAAVAAVLIPALALAGSRMLAPPKPMDVAAAVTQFRSGAAAGGGAGSRSGAPQTTADAQGGGDSVSGSAPAGARTGDNPEAARRPARTATTQGGATADRSQPAAAQSSERRTQRNTAGTSQRSQRDAAKRSMPPTPQEGVYRYATQGYESIDQPSSRHDYPRETAMTIRHNDCGGFVAHWQPLENRWDEMTICSSNAGSFIPTMATHREFYGQQKDSRYTCSDGYYAYRPETGATWTGRCTDKESQMQIQGRTLGREAVRVGDQTVEAVHYVVEARITGDNEGTWRAERWVDPKTGMLVRARANTDATSTSSFGTVRYQEETDLRLLSMTPER